MKKHNLTTIWIMFFLFVMSYIVNFFVELPFPPTTCMWIVLNIWAILMASSLIIQNGLPQSQSILTSCFLAAIVGLSYFTHSITTSLTGLLVTFIAGLGIFTTFEQFPKEKLRFVCTKNKLSPILSLLIGLIFGGIFAYLDYQSRLGGQLPSLQLSFTPFLGSIGPAIYEELIFRTLFYTFSINLISGKITKSSHKFTFWFMMVVPYVLVTSLDRFLTHGLVSGLITVGLTTIIFALPLSFLQKKRDIFSAVVAHYIIVVSSYLFFGL